MKYIPDEVKTLTELFAEAGQEIYMVGGCVRDMIMGIEPSDFDLATSALPLETKKILKDFKIVDTGIRHGTVTAYVNEKPFEITTYRIESGYSDGRHPDKVDFTGKLLEDLARRDFTINAMAMDFNAAVIDYFGGKEDIQRKTIRTVGNPDKRFSEDALRILRALRFSSKLGFAIEEATENAMISNKELLQNISRERIFEEVSKLLLAKYASETVKQFKTVIAETLLGANSSSDLGEKLDFFGDFLDDIYGKVDGTDVRFAALLRLTEAENPEAILRNLKVSRKLLKEVMDIIACSRQMENSFDDDEDKLVLAMVKYSGDCVKKAALVTSFCKWGEIPSGTWNYEAKIEELKETRCLELKNLAVTGDDMKKAGVTGTDIGKYLKMILREVALGHLENRKSDILDFVLEKYN